MYFMLSKSLQGSRIKSHTEVLIKSGQNNNFKLTDPDFEL